MEKQFTHEELNIIRQWFNAVKDLNPNYLEEKDERINSKILELMNKPETKTVLISDIQREFRRDFNIDSATEISDTGKPYLVFKIKGSEFRIEITSETTYRSLKIDLIKEACKKPEIASDIEFTIFTLRKSIQ